MIDKEKKVINFDMDAPSHAADATDDSKNGTEQEAPPPNRPEDSDMADEVNAAVQGQIKKDEEKLLKIELPTALAEREVKLYLAAIVTGLLGVVISLTLMSFHFLLLLALAAFFIYVALSSRLDFRDGEIVEQSLLCYNVQRTARLSGERYVSFRTSDDVPTYYRFRIRDKKADFFPGCPYLVYYHKRNPEQLIAYYQM